MRPKAKTQGTFRVARRPFLGGVGAAAGAATLLRPLIAEAEGIVPKRFLYCHYPCGTISGDTFGTNARWYWFPPSGSGANYTPSPLLKLFDAVKDSILPMDGMDLGDVAQTIRGDKVGQAMMFMGTGFLPVPIDGAPPDDDPNTKNITVPRGTKTIDQRLLEVVPDLKAPLLVGGPGPKFPSLQLSGTKKSMMGGGGFTCWSVLSYAGHDQPLFPEGRSDVAFNSIFGGAMMPGIDPMIWAKRQAQKKSMLDLVIKDIQRLRSRVPISQYPKLDAQLSAIRDLELKVTMPPPPPGSQIVKPTLVDEPTTGHNGANADEAGHQTRIRNMLEIIRCAFVSDLTRVASITYAPGNNPLRPIAFCPSPMFTSSGDGQSVSHSGKGIDALEAKGAQSQFYVALTAEVLAAMSRTPEGAGTLLDNVFGMLFTERLDGDTHSRTRNPLLLFGGKFLKLNTGQFLVAKPDHYVNDIWASALTAWGVPTNIYGDQIYASGVMPGLFGP